MPADSVDGAATALADLAVGAADADAPDLAPPADLAMGRGMLVTTPSAMPATVDLTALGTYDWAHFGLAAASDVNRKSGGPAAIALTADAALTQFGGYGPAFSWTDGAPTAAATTHSGIYISGVNHAFTVSVPADATTTRTLLLYVTNYHSTAALHAHLSDASAADFAATATAVNNVYTLYSFAYRARSAGATLQVTWTLQTAQDGSASVDVLAAALQ